ncbi:MAG: sigma-70 family RNA polymerase sigma factor [Sulfuritalea sp.]|nr:sigma-70 family RNA polymerase sigma factor [Sulfuritalea sp.]
MIGRMEDEENGLASRAQAGDRQAFAQLVRRFQDRVFGFILRMNNSRDEAMDLTQETFMKAYQALPTWRPDARFSTWLFQIARNATLDILRRRQLVEFVPLDAGQPEGEALDPPDDAPLPEEHLSGRQRIALLEQSLHELPVEQREILLLRELENMSYADIAVTLNIEAGTVKSRLARARTAVLAKFQHHAGENRHD